MGKFGTKKVYKTVVSRENMKVSGINKSRSPDALYIFIFSLCLSFARSVSLNPLYLYKRIGLHYHPTVLIWSWVRPWGHSPAQLHG